MLPPPDTICQSTSGPHSLGPPTNTVDSMIVPPTSTEWPTGTSTNDDAQRAPPNPGSQSQVTMAPTATQVPCPLHTDATGNRDVACDRHPHADTRSDAHPDAAAGAVALAHGHVHSPANAHSPLGAAVRR